MKIHHIPTGSRFVHAGQVYTKTGPMMATDSTGRTQMIPRHAVLTPADGTATRTASTGNTPDIRSAFADFYRICETLVPESGQATLKQAQIRFLAQLPPAQASDDADAASG